MSKNYYHKILFNIYFYPCFVPFVIFHSCFILYGIMNNTCEFHCAWLEDRPKWCRICLWVVISPLIVVVTLIYGTIAAICNHICWLTGFFNEFRNNCNTNINHSCYYLFRYNSHRSIYYLLNKLAYYMILDKKSPKFYDYNDHVYSKHMHGSQTNLHQKLNCINYEIMEYDFMLQSLTKIEEQVSYCYAKGYMSLDKKCEKYQNILKGITSSDTAVNSFSRSLILCQLHGMKQVQTNNAFCTEEVQVELNIKNVIVFVLVVIKQIFLVSYYPKFKNYVNRVYTIASTSTSSAIDQILWFVCALLYASLTHLSFFPLYCFVSFICSIIFSKDNTHDTNQSYVYDFNKPFEIFLFALMIVSLILSGMFMYFLCNYIIPLYYQMRLVVPKVTLCECRSPHAHCKTDISKTLARIDENVCDGIFMSILAHVRALQLRPLKLNIIEQFLNRDAANVVMSFLPVCEYKVCVGDINPDILSYDRLSTNFVAINTFECIT